MESALTDQPMAEDFKAYLLREFEVPAERIRQVACACRETETEAVPSS